MDTVARAAVERVQQSGIIFIDEIDKVAGREGGHGPDVSREGVQRDILPIVEGTTVNTKYGMVKTDHILFIAAGAFHVSKPSDLIPELQGRFPIRVELEALGREDFVRILTEPKNALVKQYTALLSTEGVMPIRFTDDAIGRIADFAALVNDRTENIGARRLHTVMEKLLDEVSFDAPDMTERTSRSTRPTSIACSPTSSATKTFPATSCESITDFATSIAIVLARCDPRRLRQEGPAAGAAAARAGRASSSSPRAAAATTWSCASCCRRPTPTGQARSISPRRDLRDHCRAGRRHAAEPRPADDDTRGRDDRRAAAARRG